MSTALFGGTFDPVHCAHLDIAREAADRFSLSKVLFVPAANPPHKTGAPVAPYEDRVRMLDLACTADARFEVSRIEAPPASGAHGRSYSILTIEKLRAAGIHPLSFLIGADAFSEVHTWHRWHDVVASVEFIVVTRPGASYEVPPGAVVRELTGIDSSASSSSVRETIEGGDDGETIRVAVPDSVLRYIRDHRLYRQSQSA